MEVLAISGVNQMTITNGIYAISVLLLLPKGIRQNRAVKGEYYSEV